MSRVFSLVNGRSGKGPWDEAELGPVDWMVAPGKANGKYWGENP